MSSSGKLDTWLRLAQGMEDGRIIGLSDYQPPAETKDFVDQITSFDLEKRIDFSRSVVIEMGAKS